ncbi:hypothetical protein VOLCADRAFT_105296 [Volvox carteri f. nagariensis]|uniref:Expansin-like EG45 domain-containing protein n=1 Tax=Volvox carteri f. nagariensis TaxID=3068 RepID=D8TZV1_VOLCA|nr:uncharacterized protein VOLCADRAFT_105296 [Volvox carteri f. nagariensis]EFJ47081.1 hypothetical protein VOLCADRAFT_105296 [Volvox carteri f. nagariensis]|eukprot:XP_002951976.1 hypothetical protein VOLCADRAFT_105296 [Volvox carteri f. nagariensis]
MELLLAIALGAALFGGFGSPASAGYDWQWHTGRATHYGGPGDPWSIHNGHCAYGYLDPNVEARKSSSGPDELGGSWTARPSEKFSNKFDNSVSVALRLSSVRTGWDICAPSDQNWDYDAATSNCGLCYEVACQGMDFNDFYGNSLERQSVCYDSSASVILMVTDLCPCYYPANQYSNKRWCCGDMQHFDISSYAFQKLADMKWGVIGVKYRRVPCDYQPANRAQLPSFMQGWSDSGSWSISRWGRDSSWGFDGQQAYCVTMGGYAGIQFNGWSGVFSSKRTLEFYARQNNGGTPDVSIKLTAPSGGCKALQLRDMTPKDQTSNWSRFQVQLSAFDWRQSGGGDGSAFGGCSDSINDWSVNVLVIMNNWGGNQDLCIDQVKVY